MASDIQTLASRLQERFGSILNNCIVAKDEVTIEVPAAEIRKVCTALRDEKEFAFEQLIDVCGVDYSTYGSTEWETEETTESGFSRGVSAAHRDERHVWHGERFAVVYHLLSYANNQRLRIRAYVNEELPLIDSVVGIWRVADWFEREAFDLYGIIFEGHPDLRRLLTDYGFIGHPFRKDFPLIGNVEMRYDPEKQRVIYEQVSIEPRVLVPRVIRDDQRYTSEPEGEA